MTPMWLVGLALTGLLPGDKALEQPLAKQSFTGKVQPLAVVLEQRGVKWDADAVGNALAFVADNGKVYSLIKDDGARMLFLDKELHNRQLKLTGKLLAGSHLLQVSQVHSIVDGKLHEVYYWCANCLLRYSEPCACECCGSPTVRYEVPVP